MRISAVIPTFNRGSLIDRALTSILDQSCPPDEIVVVDDGSTDDTEHRVRQYGDRVRYLRQPNAGAAAARNAGVHATSAEFVAFLDSDDYWFPDHLAVLADACRKTDKRAALYFANCYFSAPGFPDGDETLWGLADFWPGRPWAYQADPFGWALMQIQPTMLQASMISKSAYLEVGGLRTDLPVREDTEFFFALALRYPWCAVDHVGTRMTPEADNRLTSEFTAASLEYWYATVSMYTTLVRSARGRPRNERAELRSRLAAAHWRLARSFGPHRQPVEMAWHLVRATKLSPATVARKLLPSTARGRAASRA